MDLNLDDSKPNSSEATGYSIIKSVCLRNFCQVFGHIILPFAAIWHVGPMGERQGERGTPWYGLNGEMPVFNYDPTDLAELSMLPWI